MLLFPLFEFWTNEDVGDVVDVDDDTDAEDDVEDDEEDDTVAEFVDAFVLLPPLAFVAFGGFDPLGELTVDVFVPIAAATFGPPDGAAPKFGAGIFWQIGNGLAEM